MSHVLFSECAPNTPLLRSVIGFSCDCGEPSVKAGMSIQLLSVCLAALIALFKDSELALQVSQEDLMLLIRETATALLDPRLVQGQSELDDATCKQMVRAINKTTIAAACGVPRHTSLQALLTIQQQLCLEAANDSDNDAFQKSLSRVITKLLGRVVRHEEECMEKPFSTDVVDMEALVCTMEDTLVACNGAPLGMAIDICKDMVKSLIQAIVKAHGGSTDILLGLLDDLGIDSGVSDLGKLVHNIYDAPPAAQHLETIPLEPKAGPSVAVLVNSFVSAREESERQKALEDLRVYKKEHGESDLKNHLEQVSPAFRAFLEEQLGALKDESPEKPVAEKTSSMSERLRNLRSRIAGSDLKVSTDTALIEGISAPSPLASTGSSSVGFASSLAAGATPLRAGQTVSTTSQRAEEQVSLEASFSALPRESPRRTTGIPSPASTSRSSRLAHPSPSKLPTPSSFQQRLAASAHPSAENSNRASALRARLEAVRRQGGK